MLFLAFSLFLFYLFKGPFNLFLFSLFRDFYPEVAFKLVFDLSGLSHGFSFFELILSQKVNLINSDFEFSSSRILLPSHCLLEHSVNFQFLPTNSSELSFSNASFPEVRCNARGIIFPLIYNFLTLFIGFRNVSIKGKKRLT